MKKIVVERTLVVLMACAASVGVTSCGNDATDQPPPATPPAASPAPKTPAAKPPTPAASPAASSAPETPVAEPSASAAPPAASPAPETSVAEPSAPATSPVAAPEPEQVQSSNPPPSPPHVAEQVSVAAADTDATIKSLTQVAQRRGADFLTPARAWVGDSLRRKLWACEIAKSTGRVADLIVLAREARAACSGSEETFGNLYRVAQYFESVKAYNEAWEALDKAFPRARAEKIPKERQEEAKKLWRRVSRAK